MALFARALTAWLILWAAPAFGMPLAVTNVAAGESQVLVMLHLPPPHYRAAANYGSYENAPGHEARRRIADALARAHGLVLESDWPMPVLGVDCYVLSVPSTRNVADVVHDLTRDPRTQWAQPLNTFHGLDRPAESLYALQPGASLWHLRELHTLSTGRGVRIAIVDSGVDAAHPALAGRLAEDRNFVDAADPPAESHGTAIAGIIGAAASDNAQVIGIAPQARLLALRACWQVSAEQTLCNSFTLAKALQFAIQARADVINLSLGGPQDELLSRLLDAAHARGILTVAAVDPQAPDGGFPASHAGVLAVADATTAIPALMAPGRDIPAPAPGGGYAFVSGTSFAAAEVSGLAALVRQLAPTAAMANPAAWVTFPMSPPQSRAGMIDACATLRKATAGIACASAQGTHNAW